MENATFFQKFRDALIPGTILEKSMEYTRDLEDNRQLFDIKVLGDLAKFPEDKKELVLSGRLTGMIARRAQKRSNISIEDKNRKAKTFGTLQGIITEFASLAPLASAGFYEFSKENSDPEVSAIYLLTTVLVRQGFYNLFDVLGEKYRQRSIEMKKELENDGYLDRVSNQ
jgi:hypothetical protein